MPIYLDFQTMATTTMNISLPETMKAFVDERLVSDGYGSVSEYVRELIRGDQKRRENERLERLLLERLQSKNDREFEISEVEAELAKRLTLKNEDRLR
ncbi:MAG: type II toxin-antitoxin system ParD family antitoxin [Acidobacteria bacterium]|nr:type II toxin-antitoxin system ParD family antitoxin [Acidobacteriota bacterium]